MPVDQEEQTGLAIVCLPTSGSSIGIPFLGHPKISNSEIHGMLTLLKKKNTDAAVQEKMLMTASMVFALLQIQRNCK